ncbi:MAG: NAD(P)/FAD-dependent oxidoreductase [Candidatus Kapaibacterium sp.]
MTDVLIIGGGAAGLMCARTAALRGKSVLVVERAEKIGKKILISGGGRCNFTNMDVRSENYISQNPHFCRSALARYTPQDFIAMVEQHGIAYHEKTLGQLFCDGSSREIVAMFEKELRISGVRILCNAHDVWVRRKGEHWVVRACGEDHDAASVVVATGGLSIPKMGATDYGLQLAREFGHTIVPTQPALVPLTFSAADREVFSSLSGVSLPTEIRCGSTTFRESSLFTHKGVSGPAILQISSYWKQGSSIHMNLLPDADQLRELRSEHASRMEFKNVLARFIPKRLAETWSMMHGANQPFYRLHAKECEELLEQLQDWTLQPAGTEGYDKAEVTAGGVDTRELSSKTMESARVSGLYFIGEVVDVTGWLGGYNFQWAWASGYAAGMHV